MDLTMAFVGTRSMFEAVGFVVVGRTEAVASRMPRLVMRGSATSAPHHGRRRGGAAYSPATASSTEPTFWPEPAYR